jgi:hypothetical protein
VRGAACELAVTKAREALGELARTLERYGQDPRLSAEGERAVSGT